MHIDDMNSAAPVYYLDRLQRPWWLIGRAPVPTLSLQRVGCILHPMDMPRLSVIPSSMWAQENWTRVDEDNFHVQIALAENNWRR